ncbi:MAG: PIN domain-containing protein [Saprospiraceae bacterium]|nr:PIN domain-containing protein [Saprospiraceae bacterium]
MGRLIILDTNAVVALLKSNQKMLEYVQKADSIGISVITQIEFLAFSNLSEHDAKLFEKFISRIDVYDILSFDSNMIQKIIEIRKTNKVRLPDAIIAATAC